MREISAEQITQAVAQMCTHANLYLPDDVSAALDRATAHEKWPPAQRILTKLQENRRIAAEQQLPLCQDTGMIHLFITIGQEVHIQGSLTDALNQGVRQGSAQGRLRASVVQDPLNRINTKDNAPAILHYNIVPGDQLRILVAPKGFGSENMSRIAMLAPSAGREGVKAFVLETVRLAGSNPCPPIVVGVGIGGSFEYAAILAKKALLRPLDQPNPQADYAAFEQELLEGINDLGIGPQGLGGDTTALGVQVEVYPTHIASLPCAVSLGCHVTRHEEVIL